MDKLYENIKKRREALNMSQETLAQKVGYTSRSSIAKIENGGVDIPRSKIIAFSKALKCSPMELMGWTGTQNKQSSTSGEEPLINEVILNRNGKIVRKQYTKEEMEIVSKMIEALGKDSEQDPRL